MPGKKKRRRRSRDVSSAGKGRPGSAPPVARVTRGLPLDKVLSAVHRRISRAVKDPELRSLMRQLERETAEREGDP